MTAPIVDLEAERAVLTACLSDSRDVSRALTVVSSADFYDPLHRRLFGLMTELDGSEWDPVLIAREVRRQAGENEARRAISLMVDLGAAPSSGTVLGHSGAIAEASRNRRIVTELRRALVAAESKRPDEALEIVSALDSVSAARSEVIRFRDLLHEAYTVASEPRAKSTITWGHHQLDDMSGGMRPGMTGVIAAASSQGKSSMAIAIVDENKKRGVKCLIVSLEDGKEIYGNRFLSRRSGVPAKRIRDHALESEDHSRLTSAVASADTEPVFAYYENTPWERIAVDIERTVVREQVDLVVLDYIQECWCETKYQSRQLELQAIARRFRGIIRKRHRAGLILSQLTGTEPGKPPSKEMVRECKDIANGAEQILILYTTSEGDKMGNLDKAKDGKTGLVSLSWDEDTASYKRVTNVDEAMAWADERYDGFSAAVGDLNDQFNDAF